MISQSTFDKIVYPDIPMKETEIIEDL